MISASGHRLLQQARRRVLSSEEMNHVIDGIYGPKTWTAIEFAVTRPESKSALFLSLLKESRIEVGEIKT